MAEEDGVHDSWRQVNPEPSSLDEGEAFRSDSQWAALDKVLQAVGLDEVAYETRAFRPRRTRVIPSASLLVRLLLFYVFTPQGSLRHATSAFLLFSQHSLSAIALRKRLRTSYELASQLLGRLLENLPLSPSSSSFELTLRFVDATVITALHTGEASSALSNHRVHLAFDFLSGIIRQVVYSKNDRNAGETLQHFTIQPGELWIGDRIYCATVGIRHVLQAGGQVLVRFRRSRTALSWSASERKEVALLPFLKAHPDLAEPGQAAEFSMFYGGFNREKDKPIPVRLLVLHLSPEAAERERAKARKNNGHLDEENSQLCSYLILLTTASASQLSLPLVLVIYRLRWQIELYIKVSKSLGQLSKIRVRDPELVSSCIMWYFVGIAMFQQIWVEKGVKASAFSEGVSSEDVIGQTVQTEGPLRCASLSGPTSPSPPASRSEPPVPSWPELAPLADILWDGMRLVLEALRSSLLPFTLDDVVQHLEELRRHIDRHRKRTRPRSLQRLVRLLRRGGAPFG